MATPTISLADLAVERDGSDTRAFTSHIAAGFPSRLLVPVAAATIFDAAGSASLAARDAHEGPACFVTVSPGSIRIRRSDPARRQRALEREHQAHVKAVELDAAWLLEHPGQELPARPESTRTITEWSRKSRANMTRRLCTLDYSPLFEDGRVPAMITLTMPDGWEQITPTGKDFKKLVRLFGKRYRRAWGAELVGVWKLEFQSRGAPHLHALIAPPRGTVKGAAWSQWFAAAWADCLGVQGETRRKVIAVHQHHKASQDYAEGLRCSDPKRVAVYFTKHGLLAGKEYQHDVPEVWQLEGAGPGRFWGVWGLEVVESSAEVTIDQAVTVARTARKITAQLRAPVDEDGARDRTAVSVPLRVTSVVRGVRHQVDKKTGELREIPRRRKVKRRVKRMRGTWGFLAVNDGASFAYVLARAVEGG